MTSDIIQHLRHYQPELAAIRRDLHAHPELGLQEYRTAAIVAGKLRSWGIEVHEGVGQTGVVGVLRGRNGKRSIGLRADMDALPISEATHLAHASQTTGVMHACGHDGHTTMLLGSAKYLAETRNFDGVVNFIFQPAEEGLGGASAMIADGLFERFPCDTVFALHNIPGMPVGHYATSPGPRWAACAVFTIIITGKGGHAAFPHQTVDVIVAAFHVGAALQTIVSRSVPAQDPAVLSITYVQAGSTMNVLPQEAILKGTVRALTRATVSEIEEKLRRVVTMVAGGFGADTRVDFRFMFAPVINDAAEAQVAVASAIDLVGPDQVDGNGPPFMGAEDFGFMLEERPGAHIVIGNGDTAALHNPSYDFNDDAIPFGAAILARIAERKLEPD